jgi:hypothetical protein
MNRLFERGIMVRNQSVLQRGVNDSAETMKLLVKRLGHINVRPYYVYLHDLVQGVEDLRTTLQTALDIERTSGDPRQASTVPPSWWTRPVAAANATPTPSSTTTARPGFQSTPVPRCTPASSTSISIPSTA